ncbi:hypothetical protein [Methylibium sp.]|uniref:hypothetical protein n=1 Tax=Methylibium sp. TaxID=2067992 RepID=UPI003D10DF85
MRRWLFAFLLLVVPFQLVWGSAATYCAHEAGVSAKKHLGHHEHKHQGGSEVVAATDDADGDASGAFHLDCGSCHLSCPAFLPAGTLAVAALPNSSAIGPTEPRYDSHVPSGPHRPDRVRRAPAARFGGDVMGFSPAG